MTMKIMPKTLTGSLHNLNKGSCDWGWQGLLAYGCQCCVVVIDPNTMQMVQVLDGHRGYVVKVRWAKENYRHDLASPYGLRLASADFNGKIFVWDVVNGVVGAECSEGSKPVADMEWISIQDVSHDLLVALHPPNTLILWNMENGSRLWKKSYNDTLQSFSFDPFDSSRLAFLGQDYVVFVDDFSLSKAPASSGRKFYISSPSGQSSISHSSSTEKLAEKRNSRSTIRRVSGILVGESSRKAEDEPAQTSDCLQLIFHRACRHHLILLYTREILILDLDINQTVSIISLERSGLPFTQVISLQQRDVLMCLHENGSITVRVRRRNRTSSPGATSTAEGETSGNVTENYDVFYDHRCQSDSLRVTKHHRVFGAVMCPVSESKIAIVVSDGKALVWELTSVEYDEQSSTSAQSPMYTQGFICPETANMLPAGSHGLNLTSSAVSPKLSISDLMNNQLNILTESQANQASTERKGVLLRFVLVGLLNGLPAPPVVLRMCPALTTKNFNIYQPLLAIGASSGVIQVYNLSGGQLHREFSLHSCAVRGIEWVSLRSFLSYAHPTPINATGSVKNEIMLTDLNTGRSISLRTNSDEESPIELIRVSFLKQYFVILFREQPFELWDLRTHTLLRQMPKNFPHVTAIEWSPTHVKATKKKPVAEGSESAAETPTFSSMLNLDSASTTPSATSPEDGSTAGTPNTAASATSTHAQLERKANIASKEHFVFTDVNGLLYHFIVEGNFIKDGSKIPPDGSMGSITCIAWKAETLVLSDVDGNINLWDLKARVSRAIPTSRGWIRKIKFAPGRGNMKLIVLYNDGVDIWDTHDVERVAAVRCPKDLARVQDVDWAASDRPILASADGTIRVMDLSCSSGCSAIDDGQFLDPVFCPHALPSKASLALKCRIQHQPWRKDGYSLNDDEPETMEEIPQIVAEQLYLIDNQVKEFLMKAPFSTAQRCLIAAKLFGDESELTFWTIALHYLRAESTKPDANKTGLSISALKSDGNPNVSVASIPNTEAKDLINIDKENIIPSWLFIKDSPLETCYDILCDDASYRAYQLRRIALHDSKRVTTDHTRKCAENLILVGEADRAVQLLLETEPDNSDYYSDSLRACLVASIRSSGASQSTIKLVATNLIANGKLSEGVQLLCLIEKGLDACRYLQSYDKWDQAAWLAKVTLDTNERSEVIRRWADHLSSQQINQKDKAILILLSLGQFVKVIELLYGLRYFDRAVLFIQACQEFCLIDIEAEAVAPLIKSVYLEYSRFLLNIGMKDASTYYCGLCGDKCKDLLSETSETKLSE